MPSMMDGSSFLLIGSSEMSLMFWKDLRMQSGQDMMVRESPLVGALFCWCFGVVWRC